MANMVTCMYCSARVDGDATPRTRHEWLATSRDHNVGCEWVETQAHTRNYAEAVDAVVADLVVIVSEEGAPDGSDEGAEYVLTPDDYAHARGELGVAWADKCLPGIIELEAPLGAPPRRNWVIRDSSGREIMQLRARTKRQALDRFAAREFGAKRFDDLDLEEGETYEAINIVRSDVMRAGT